MFATPLFAHAIGCSPPDSLVWSARSVTTAIGIVIADVLGASQSVVTCIIVFTGIMGPLFGPFLYKLARVSDGKYNPDDNLCDLVVPIFFFPNNR